MARMPFKRYASFGLLACLGFTSGVQARDRLMQPAEAMVAAAKAHVVAAMDVPSGATLAVAFNPPDARLRLAQCSQPLQAQTASLPPAGGPLSVRVECPAPRWSLYLQGEAKLSAPVIMAQRDLPRGTPLQRSDFEVKTRVLHELQGGYALDADALVGRRLRQSLRQGAVIPPRATAAPLWVRTGETVTLAAGTGSLAVRMTGTALANGSANDTVRVRNGRSQRILQGRVTGPGEVQISF